MFESLTEMAVVRRAVVEEKKRRSGVFDELPTTVNHGNSAGRLITTQRKHINLCKNSYFTR
jgi:hypothetical protein